MQRIAALVISVLAFGGDATCPETPADCPDLVGCWKDPVVLKNAAAGYPDACMGLNPSNASDSAACKALCVKDVNCSVWQFSGIGETADPNGHCYLGNLPTACDSNRADFKVDAGERLQHGDIKVTKPATDHQVLGLYNYKMNTKETTAMDVSRCKAACYSDVTCGVWQYSQGECWHEHLPGNPATGTKNETGNAFVANISKDPAGGEYVMHYCPLQPAEKPEEGSNNLPWIIAAIIAGLLVCGGIAYAVMHKPPKKPKKTRAVKIEKKEEEEVVPLFVPQPTVLVQQPSVVYAAPAPTASVVYTQQAAPTYTTVSQAAPTYTVQQAAPMQSVVYSQPMMTEAVAVQQPLLAMEDPGLGQPVMIGQ